MEYIILDTKLDDTIFTKVEFTFEDGSKEIVDIAHFNSKSIEEVQQNIQNRFETEVLRKKLEKE